MKKYLDEVERTISAASRKVPRKQAAYVKQYMNSRLRYTGISVPEQRKLFRRGYSFSEESVSRQLKIWDYIWKSAAAAEVMSQALFFVEQFRGKPEVAELWSVLKQWAGRVENWGHSDSLSSIYASILEQLPEKVLPVLVRWNRHPDPWKRRLSIVSLLCYSAQRKKILPYAKLAGLVEPLLTDRQIYVQKGIGWTLREMGNVYPKETERFVRENVLLLSPIGFTTATEKWPSAKKEPLKLERKRGREAASGG